MAKGKFIWIIGNDDMILPYSLKKLETIIGDNQKLDFFFEFIFTRCKLHL